MFILNRKACHQNTIFCYIWRFIYCLIKHTQAYRYAIVMFSLVLLLLPLRRFGVVPNDCRSSLSGVLNTTIIIITASGVVNIIVTAYFIIIAVSLCCLFLINGITKLREHYRTVILNHSETKLRITVKI